MGGKDWDRPPEQLVTVGILAEAQLTLLSLDLLNERVDALYLNF
jgi:hypothetical protein